MTELLEKTRTVYKPSEPDLFDVFIHNDDVTPMEVVVAVLIEAFDKPLPMAVTLMMDVHTSDKGLVGIYPMEEAYSRVDKAFEIIDEFKSNYDLRIPLQLTVEEH